jgi:hypothetical protein
MSKDDAIPPADKDDDSIVLLKGAEEFETWFAGVSGADCDPAISHSVFGNLRGLTYKKRKGNDNNQRNNWMKIPRSIVLESDFTQQDWDAKLAQQLWFEVLQGPQSTIAGYVSLLTQGDTWTINQLPKVPPSTAPDSIRHWSSAEKSVLSDNPSGQRLLELEQTQRQIWTSKLEKVNGMTWEQFEWAMEVVHSRAFCGDFGMGGRNSFPPIVTIASPIAAGLAGYAYYVTLHGQSDDVLFGLAVLATLPSLVNLLRQDPPAAVLLPFIDSANHLEDAKSSIEYSSLNDSFTLSGDSSRCIVNESNGKQQLYISYGEKKDTELLLNYGFLRGVSSEGDSSARRRKLAEMFVARNAS